MRGDAARFVPVTVALDEWSILCAECAGEATVGCWDAQRKRFVCGECREEEQ